MNKRFIPSIAIAAALTACASPAMPPGTVDPGNPGTGNGQSVSTEQLAVSLGMSIMSSDPLGVPRLMRSFRPRAGLSGAAPEVAARDHVAALTPLWLRKAPPMALAGR